MIAFVFKPTRIVQGRRVQSRLYSGRYRLAGQRKTTTIALHVTDKEVAEKKLKGLIREIERDAIGIGVPKRLRLAAENSWMEHVNAYCADLAGRRRDAEYIATTKRRLTKLGRDCNWTRIGDVTPEAFQGWRAKQSLGPKTLNDYLAAASGLIAWLQRSGLSDTNPFKSVVKAETRGNERRLRRAFTRDELRRVVAVAGENRLAILLAYYTGLRRGELRQLEWADIHEAFVIARASTTKNREAKRCYLPSWFVTELQANKPDQSTGSVRVLVPGSIPSMWIFKRLLERAGIAYKDAQGRQADFHALRRSLNTHLAEQGIDPHTRKEIMRHSDLRLTLDVYTDGAMLPVAAAIEKLPVFANAQINAHNSGAAGHQQTLADTEIAVGNETQAPVNEERRRSLSLTDVVEQNSEDNCLARTRT